MYHALHVLDTTEQDISNETIQVLEMY